MKEKKILKKSDKCLAVATVGIGTTLLGLISFMSCIPFAFKESKVVKDAGYDKFNDQYKQECLAKLSEDYQAGVINIEEFMKKSQNLKNYDVDIYMQEYAAENEKEEFNNIRETVDILTPIGCTVSGLGISVAAVGTAALVVTSAKERKAHNDKTNNVDKGIEV